MLKTTKIVGKDRVLLPKNDADKVFLFALYYVTHEHDEYGLDAVFNCVKGHISTLEDNTIVLMLQCFNRSSTPLRSALERERDRRGLIDPEA